MQKPPQQRGLLLISKNWRAGGWCVHCSRRRGIFGWPVPACVGGFGPSGRSHSELWRLTMTQQMAAYRTINIKIFQSQAVAGYQEAGPQYNSHGKAKQQKILHLRRKIHGHQEDFCLQQEMPGPFQVSPVRNCKSWPGQEWRKWHHPHLRSPLGYRSVFQDLQKQPAAS